MSEVYQAIRNTLKPVPAKPYYLFNFKDVAKVVHGLQLVASKSKPIKEKNKKFDYSEDQSMQQTALFVKLFCHETLRVFGDRITDTDGKFPTTIE